MNDYIILIPGIFGFGTFGTQAGKVIDYFAEVKGELSKPESAGIPVERIISAEPGPTASLKHRARELVEEIEAVLAAPGTPPDAKVHLIGHSTGGVDARLVANDGYTITGVDPWRRSRVRERIGTIVTIAAPFYGTPVAVKLRPEFQALLATLSIWNVLDHAGTDLGKAGPWLAMMLSSIEALGRDPDANRAVIDLLESLKLDPVTVSQIAAFRGHLLEDASLIDDLAPHEMARLDQTKRGQDFPRIKSFVTIAPRPSVGDFTALERRALYYLFYHSTESSAFTPRSLPEGPWVVEPDDSHPDLGRAPEANDGVVPSSSQTIGGQAAGLILADHLDVIGHFDDQQNTTLFKSGSNLTRARFEKLWRSIGKSLAD